MIDRPVPDHDFESADLGDATPPKWALMALDPSGNRQLLVRRLVSGIESDAMVFRQLGGEEKLSVAKWNREAYGEAKMARPDREVRVARLLASSGHAARFARLLASQDTVGGYRESWWEYYQLGDMQDLFTGAFRFVNALPISLVFRCLGQVLEGIQCLNQLDMRHMDLHARNIFFHLDEGASYPDATIGDFGHSRFKGERAPKFTTSQLVAMIDSDKEVHLSPSMDEDETFGIEDWSWRLRWDLHKFQKDAPEVLLEKFSRTNARNELLFSFLNRMAKMCEQDEKDRRLPEAERPPIQDLTALIEDIKTLERLYAETDSDKVALGAVRQKMLDHVRLGPSQPPSYDTEHQARIGFEKFIAAGILRAVNLTDQNSIEVATAELAAHKVKDSAFVSDQSGKSSSSDTSDSMSPAPSLQTRESTPEGDSVQQVANQQSTGGQASSTSSHASTRWSPATRGLAEATAFAQGDASAVDALLEARDVAERSQALVRNEHARRRSPGQRLGRLFRR